MSVRTHLWAGFWLAAVCSFSSGPLIAAESEAEAQARLLTDVKTLADDRFEGRGVGTAGLDLAAEYLKEKFKAAGVKVIPDDASPSQKFELVTSSKLGEKNSLTVTGPEGQTIAWKLDEDFEVCSFGGSGSFHTELVFCGYGIDDPDSKYNDFADVDVKDKVIVIMRRTPGQSDPHGPFATVHGISRHAELRTKMSQAIQHGAVGVIFVNDPYTIQKAASDRTESVQKAQQEIARLADEFLSIQNDAKRSEAAKDKLSKAVQQWKGLTKTASPMEDPLMEFGYAGHTENTATPPAFHVKIDKMNVILKAALGKTLAELEADIDSDGKPRSAVLSGWKVQGTASVEQVKSTVSNVIAVLEGEGPLADETIVVGAHYDHVGRGGVNSLARGSTEIHNGADDNASGTAALLEVARRLAKRPQALPRRVVFIAFTGEELGLLGSARYVKDPLYPLDKTIAMFNMDMVGRLNDDKLTVFGTGTSTRWEQELNQFNEKLGFKLTFKPEGFGPSDHSSFYGKKIPVLHLFTGNHPDYHRPSDDWEKLNIEGMSRVVELLEQMIVATAENKNRPDYVEVKQAANPMRGGSRPYFGTIPDFSEEGEGYAISGAAPGSPADKGGLLAGDRIVELGGNKVTSLDDFDLALRKFNAGQEVAVVVLRNEKRVELKVTLEPPR